MSLNAEFLADNPVASTGSIAPPVYGGRTGWMLGAAMVIAFALVTFLRWTGSPPAKLETVVQQPISADAANNSSRVDLTAPDPGDDPP